MLSAAGYKCLPTRCFLNPEFQFYLCKPAGYRFLPTRPAQCSYDFNCIPVQLRDTSVCPQRRFVGLHCVSVQLRGLPAQALRKPCKSAEQFRTQEMRQSIVTHFLVRCLMTNGQVLCLLHLDPRSCSDRLPAVPSSFDQ